MKQQALRPSLQEQPLVLLRAIASSHGIEAEGLRAEALIEQLEQRLLSAESLARLVEGLEPAAREALALVQLHEGQMPSHRLQRDPLGGELRQLGAGALERLRPWEEPISPTERLFYLGLLYSAHGVAHDFRGQLLYVPPDVLALLPPLPPPPLPSTIEPLDGLPPGVREGNLSLVEDAFAVLSDLQQRNVTPVKGKYLPADALHRLNERLTVPEAASALQSERDTQRLALLMHLMRTLRLIEETSEALLKPVTRRARAWLQLPRARRLLTLQRTWGDDLTWNDLWRIPTLRPEATGWRNEPQRARALLVQRLRPLADGQWYAIGDFVRLVRRLDPDFQRPDGDYNSWYIRHAESGQLLSGWESWDQVEGTLLRYFFAGPLFWLGVVDLGYLTPSDKQPFAFRLTPYGARWLGHPVELPPAPPRAPLLIASDGTISVPAGADDWERMHLERLSVPVEGGRGDYRLHKERIIEELMEGTEIERVVRFLEQATDNLLPEAVSERLREWAGGHRRVTISALTVLEVDDAALLGELQRMPRLAPFLVRRLGPRAAVVEGQQLKALTAALRAAGYLPRLSLPDSEEPS